VGTNRPEFASYLSYLNSVQDDVRIEMHYRGDPAAAVDEQPRFDIVVGPYLSSPSVRGRFEPLEELFDEGFVSREVFYPRLLSSGADEEHQYLLPISFNIPAAVFRVDGPGGGQGLVLSLDEMRARSAAYNEGGEEAYTKVGYSPAWNRMFPLLAVRLLGADFEANPDGELTWDAEAVAEGVAYLREWITVDNGGPSLLAAFDEKYRYDPAHNLVRDGRVLYTVLRSDELFTLPLARREGMDFRWLAQNDRIPVYADVVFAGIPIGARNSAAARGVLLQLVSVALQERLLERSFAAQLNSRVFGFAGGFSSLREVSERAYPAHYPALIGHSAPADFLDFPGPLTVDWARVREDLLLPWLAAHLGGGDTVDAAGLSEQLGAHLREGLDRMAREKE
jgi:hypothetical protein